MSIQVERQCSARIVVQAVAPSLEEALELASKDMDAYAIKGIVTSINATVSPDATATATSTTQCPYKSNILGETKGFCLAERLGQPLDCESEQVDDFFKK